MGTVHALSKSVEVAVVLHCITFFLEFSLTSRLMLKELGDMSTQFRNSVIEAGRKRRECGMTSHLIK